MVDSEREAKTILQPALDLFSGAAGASYLDLARVVQACLEQADPASLEILRIVRMFNNLCRAANEGRL